MSSRFLFVDVDGVFHPADAHFALDDIKVPLVELQAAGMFRHVGLLASTLVDHTEVRLVVHSSWRHTHSDDELRLLFGPLSSRVVGATDRALDRQLSVFDFALRRQLAPAQYRVLDDQPELLEELGDVVISCDPNLGLAAPATQRQLQAWLNGTEER